MKAHRRESSRKIQEDFEEVADLAPLWPETCFRVEPLVCLKTGVRLHMQALLHAYPLHVFIGKDYVTESVTSTKYVSPTQVKWPRIPVVTKFVSSVLSPAVLPEDDHSVVVEVLLKVRHFIGVYFDFKYNYNFSLSPKGKPFYRNNELLRKSHPPSHSCKVTILGFCC
jgi:hypothetical protein